MIANLPLLFANGNPTALSVIKTAELEKFITFMVTCSWGHDTAKDIRQPPWWPKDVMFSHPFVRPAEVPKDWDSRLKNLVKKCYEYHKSAFLLVFSAQLARYPRNRLRYVDNRDHTTSLYYRPNGRLLVTFRNENLHYHRNTPKSIDDTQIKSTDIYLCDNCDSHFDNLDILKAHERLCNNENIPSSTIGGGLPEFLSALKLHPAGQTFEDPVKCDPDNGAKSKNPRNAASIDRGPPYPFSSLAYLRNAKTNSQRDMSFSRERIERFCCTTTPFSKNYNVKIKNQQFPVRYRRPLSYWNRKYVFPYQRNKKILDIKAQLLLLKCKPITVNVDRMSEKRIQEYLDELRKERESKQQCIEDKDIVFVDGLDCDQPADSETMDPLKRLDNDCEVIDLCSDDETPSVNENCDPRAGVTCVIRGGAVLRRTAATPQALPAEPCGARQRPLPAAVLQPHPVILIAHTHPLNNLQTISID
uniref:Nuclear respiratory factor 1 NLS/DNA-binding dimerisation domain-containing protein n=1 Tax=Heliothis virescens TaxID=7102 RepID=A0A2A4JGK4_HELVI